MSIKVHTNNVPRDIVAGFYLTEKEREQFDYLDWSLDITEWGSSFFKYKGQWYDLNEATITNVVGWDGYYADSAFSCTLIKLVNDGESVIVGQIFS